MQIRRARNPRWTRWTALTVALLLMAQLLAACGGAKETSQPQSGSQAPASSPPAQSQPAPAAKAYEGMEEIPAIKNAASEEEKTRIAELIKGARAEGGLTWYGPQIEPQQAEAALAAFKEYYGLTDLKTEYTYAAPGETVTKVEELLRANRHSVDVVWNSAYSWYQDLQKRDLLLAYDSPEYANYSISEAQGMSNRPYWVSDAYAFHPMYNAEKVAAVMGADWKPTSWWDFTDPKLKGLLSVGDVLASTSHAQTMQGLRKALGDDYFKQLAANVQPVTFNRSAQGRDWVGSGEYPVTFSSHAKNTNTLRSRGVQGIELVYPKEGIVLLPFTLAILKDAPHPNASKLFVDFARSTRGLETILNAGGLIFPGRPGVKSPAPDILPPVEELKLVEMNWNEEGTRDAINQVREMWKSLGLGR